MLVLISQAAMEVAAVAIAIGLGTALVSKKIINQDRQEEIKAEVKRVQDEYKEAMKSGDKARIGTAQANQKQSMGLYKEMMMTSFKPMLITFIPLVIVLTTMSSTYGESGNIVDVPIIGQLSWFWWYLIVAIFTGIMVEIVYKQYRKRKKARK